MSFSFKRRSISRVIDKCFCEFASKLYWEKRYKKQKGFYEWYSSYDQLKIFFDLYLPNKSISILNVGSGNSELPLKMYEDGYENITNIDFSSEVISKMKKKVINIYPKMIYEEMDVTKMRFEDNSFDFVIDKGTLDALLCGKGCEEKKMLKEIERVLKGKGIYFCISHSGPETRMQYLSKYNWKITVHLLKKYYEDKERFCYLFMMNKFISDRE